MIFQIENFQDYSAAISVLIHSTENKDKILSKISSAFGIQFENNKFDEIVTEGHWKNEISLIKIELDETQTRIVLEKVYRNLSILDRNIISESFRRSTDEKENFYLRLDKQNICNGKIALSDKDSIKLKFKPKNRYKQYNKINQRDGY
jgi:RNA binding exosome subunit